MSNDEADMAISTLLCIDDIEELDISLYQTLQKMVCMQHRWCKNAVV